MALGGPSHAATLPAPGPPAGPPASEPAELVEREGELADLDAAVASAAAGEGRVVLIEGDAGIGKSRLLADARDRARAHGFRILSARGLEQEQDVAFGLALRLLEPALRGIDASARRRLLAGPAAPAAALLAGRPAGDPVAGTDHGHALVHALQSVVANLTAPVGTGGAPRPLLLGVDDLQWSDASSQRFLAYVGAQVDGLPVALVAAAPPDRPGVPIRPLDALAAATGARVLRPRPLSADAAARIVQHGLPDATPAFTRACVDIARGNPFFLRELLASARSDGLAPTDGAAAELAGLLPESVLRSVLARMARLPAGARELAAAAAVLGDGAPLGQAGSLAGLHAPGDQEEAADSLAGARIVEPGEPLVFTHPLVRAAIYADQPAMARSRAHRRAAAMLADAGAPPDAVAAHLLECRPEGDRDTAQALHAAATLAGGRGELHAAERFLTRALAEPPAPPARADLLAELALVQAALGAPDALERVRDALAVIEDSPQRARTLQALAHLLFARSDGPAAARAIDLAAHAVAPGEPLADGLVVDQLLIAQVAGEPSVAATAEARLQAIQAGGAPLPPGLPCLLVARAAAAGGTAAEIETLARDALRRLPPDDGFYGAILGSAVLPLVWVDADDPAATTIEAALGHARDRGSLVAAATALHWRAALRLNRGDLVGATGDAEQVLETCALGWDMCTGWVAPLLALARIERGELTAAADAIALAERRDRPAVERALCLEARGRLALARDDPHGALRDLLDAGALAESHGLGRQPTVMPWRLHAALAAHTLGDAARARMLATEELEHARAIGAPRTLGAALRVYGLVGPQRDSLADLEEAVAVLAGSPAVLEHARALMSLGAARRRAGHRAAAREPLRQAVELAEGCQAVPMAARAAAELRAAGGRRRAARQQTGIAALTPSERRIAELAARGLPTPQIARALYVTPKTVEWHLGHVYHKLEISSRRQLGGVLEAA